MRFQDYRKKSSIVLQDKSQLSKLPTCQFSLVLSCLQSISLVHRYLPKTTFTAVCKFIPNSFSSPKRLLFILWDVWSNIYKSTQVLFRIQKNVLTHSAVSKVHVTEWLRRPPRTESNFRCPPYCEPSTITATYNETLPEFFFYFSCPVATLSRTSFWFHNLFSPLSIDHWKCRIKRVFSCIGHHNVTKITELKNRMIIVIVHIYRFITSSANRGRRKDHKGTRHFLSRKKKKNI